jgi:phenylacetate-CoA ligase
MNSKLKKFYGNAIENQMAPEVYQLNFEKRRAIVAHAYETTTFYKKKYDQNGIVPENIKTEDDFNKLPIVTREEIKNNFPDFISKKAHKTDYYKATTGGSTGVPLTVLHDKRYSLAPIQWRVMDWWGIKPYDNAAFIYRLRRTGFSKIVNSLLWWPTKRIVLDASEMDEARIMSFIKAFNKVKPTLLQGYVGAVYEFALFIKDHHIKIESPKAVWVTSAPLSCQQRNIMQEVFNAPVFDQYGSCEIMWLGAECKEHKGLHMMSDIRHIEFVNEMNKTVPANTWGKILITDLQNYAFPLIRYEIGDYGRALDFDCKCGLKLPLMDNVKGRISDLVKTPTGLRISGEYLTTIFDDFPGAVREFQLIQGKDYAIQLLYVPNELDNLSTVISSVMGNLIKKTQNQVKVSAKQVDKISHFKGKTQFIISELN